MLVLPNGTRGFPSLFDELFDDVFFSYNQSPASMEWDEDGNKGTITIEAPGFSRDDIKIESDSKGITITGEISDENSKKRLSRSSFSYVLKRTDLDPKGTSAKLNDGILSIEVSKEKDKKAKVIEIQ